MAKNEQSIVKAVQGLTKATNDLNETAQAILEMVSGETETKTAAVEADDLESMSIQALRKLAKSLDIPGGGSKDKLIEAIREAQGVDEEEDEEEEVDLEELSDKELLELAEEHEVEVPMKGKGKNKKVDRDSLIEALAEVLGSDDEDEDEEEVDLEELSDKELLELAEEHEVEAPYKGKGKNKKLDRDALIEALSEAMGDDEEEDEDEDESDDGDEDEEEGLTEDDLEGMEDDELKELAEEYDIDLGKKFNRKKAIKAILEFIDSEDEE